MAVRVGIRLGCAFLLPLKSVSDSGNTPFGCTLILPYALSKLPPSLSMNAMAYPGYICNNCLHSLFPPLALAALSLVLAHGVMWAFILFVIGSIT